MEGKIKVRFVGGPWGGMTAIVPASKSQPNAPRNVAALDKQNNKVGKYIPIDNKANNVIFMKFISK